MKNLKFNLFTVLISAFLFLASCEKNHEETISDSVNSEFEEPIFKLTDISEIESPDFEGASEESCIKLRKPEKHDGLKPCEKHAARDENKMEGRDVKDTKDNKGTKDGGKGTKDEGKGGKDDKGNKDTKNTKDGRTDKGKDTKKQDGTKDKGGNVKEKHKADPHDLPFILKQLKLNERQINAVRGFLKQYCDCLADHLKRANDINKHIIEKANAKRDELLLAAKNGRITKAELNVKLKALNERTKEELSKNDAKRVHVDIMKKCRQNLLKNISTVLNNAQKDKFHRWAKENIR